MLFNIIIHCNRRTRDRVSDMKYTTRTRTEIMSQILRVANGGGVTKTKIMYQAFLSYGQMKEHLMVLTQNGLLSYDLDTRKFKTTEKGLGFLDTFNQMDGMISEAPQ
jgi:predicted transcriptional regulator